ncbi:MAG TPA: phosphatase PAP2 family protein [Planctomycetota bacterium]|nr:phosphatase PAP2 family protein [Planctomycetota bacterium]
MRTALSLVACALLVAACGTLRNGHRWGEDATLAPGGERLAQAAHDAAVDPWTWVPLAGAGAIAAGGWDDNISDWARRQNPVFGSSKHAEDSGDTLSSIAGDAWLLSLVATPSGDEAGPWAADKARGFGVEWSATWVTAEITSALKREFPDKRPDGTGNGSFPSSGASEAFAYATLARRNLDSIDVSPVSRGVMQAGVMGVAAAEAWSRVEAGKHDPTDVLVGAALGNFCARFVHDAFLGLPDDVQVSAFVDPPRGRYALGLTFRF